MLSFSRQKNMSSHGQKPVSKRNTFVKSSATLCFAVGFVRLLLPQVNSGIFYSLRISQYCKLYLILQIYV